MGNVKEFMTPIAFIFFNRMECTKKTFTRIKELKPRCLYLISDGPRNDNEKKVVSSIREYIESEIDWDCSVHKNFSDKNLGCKNRVISGITWVFDSEEKAIILEDDCIPNLSFFWFCDELLERYKDDSRVMTISGNINVPDYVPDDSYLFARLLHVWGWATWKRAWDLYDVQMSGYDKKRRDKNWLRWLPDRFRESKLNDFDLVYSGKLDTWDYQWQYCIWQNKGLCIKPNVNTIVNVGFDDMATHTKTRLKLLDKLTYGEIEFPLKHPDDIHIDETYEKLILAEFETNCSPVTTMRLKRFLRGVKRMLQL